MNDIHTAAAASVLAWVDDILRAQTDTTSTRCITRNDAIVCFFPEPHVDTAGRDMRRAYHRRQRARRRRR